MQKARIELSNSRNSDSITAATRELIKEKGYRQVSVQDIQNFIGRVVTEQRCSLSVIYPPEQEETQ